MTEPLLFCGEMAEGRLNRLNVGMAHPRRDRGDTGQAIPSFVRGDTDYDEESGDPLGKINEENRCAAITRDSVSPTAH